MPKDLSEPWDWGPYGGPRANEAGNNGELRIHDRGTRMASAMVRHVSLSMERIIRPPWCGRSHEKGKD